MYRNEYDIAKSYLNDIVATEHYSLASDSDVIMAYIYGERPHTIEYPISTYADVLLSLAECDFHLGNNSVAWNNAKAVADTKETFVGKTAPDELLEYISAIRKISMPNVIGRFAFLKRTGLAKSELKLEDYQLLFPIPSSDIKRNPNLTQNPGY